MRSCGILAAFLLAFPRTIRKRCGGDRGGAGRQNDMAGGRDGDMGGLACRAGAAGGTPQGTLTHGHVWGFRVVLSVAGRERLYLMFRKIGGGTFLSRAFDHTRVRQRCSDADEIAHQANQAGRILKRECDAS